MNTKKYVCYKINISYVIGLGGKVFTSNVACSISSICAYAVFWYYFSISQSSEDFGTLLGNIYSIMMEWL